MSTERRMLWLLLVVVVAAIPAAVLRAACVGRSCDRPDSAGRGVPFCSLPGDLRGLIAAGFRDGRTPHVMGVTGSTGVRGATALSPGGSWPSASGGIPGVIPLVFHGTGVRSRATVPAGTRLDAVAPTVAEVIGLRRPHPGVRSGEAIPGVAAGGAAPGLVLEVVFKGVGAGDFQAEPGAWPVLRGLLGDGPGTLEGDVGSLPLDPASVLATIGTGGLPSDHGITGSLVRNDEGRVVQAWGPGAPFSVIATLGDDLDELLDQEPRIGLVGTEVTDRGLIGGNWYIEGDRDDVTTVDRGGPAATVKQAERMLGRGYGRDRVPDLLAVTLEGPIPRLDSALGRLIEAADRASGGSTAVVVTSTGSDESSGPDTLSSSDVEEQVERRVGPVVEATGLGGLFLDQEALASGGITEDRVIRALRAVRDPRGRQVMADAFPATAVTFARYC